MIDMNALTPAPDSEAARLLETFERWNKFLTDYLMGTYGEKDEWEEVTTLADGIRAILARQPAAPVVHAINCEISEMLGPDCTCGAQPAAQSDGAKFDESFGYSLAMAVLQSALYHKLGDVERGECDALIAAGMEAYDPNRQPAAREPEGQWVPKEPTEKMMLAGGNLISGSPAFCMFRAQEVYKAMLRASEPTEGESK